MPLLDGFDDCDLHPQIVEAVKVLYARKEEYTRATTSIDGQYLKALEASNDGPSIECAAVCAQVDAVRSLF